MKNSTIFFDLLRIPSSIVLWEDFIVLWENSIALWEDSIVLWENFTVLKQDSILLKQTKCVGEHVYEKNVYEN